MATIRAAAYWSRFDDTPTECVPTQLEIQKIADTGFDTMYFAEMDYYNQMNDFEDILNYQKGYTPDDNPIKTALLQIKDSGMKAQIIMYPTRYGELYAGGRTCVGGTVNGDQCVGGVWRENSDINKSKMLITNYKNIFLKHIKYLTDNNLVDSIQIEEAHFDGIPVADQMAFLQECRVQIPSNVLFYANNASNSRTNVAKNWDINLINSGTILDYVGIQPAYPYAYYEQKAAYDSWKLMLPDIPIIVACYTLTHDGANPNMINNVQQAVDNDWDLVVSPCTSIKPEQYPLLQAIFSACPKPQFSFQITQV